MLKNAKRKAIGADSESLITTRYLQPEEPLPLVIEPSVEGVDLAAWLGANLPYVETQLLTHGGILFRGFGASTPESFEQSAKAFGHELLAYTERTAPRIELRPQVYTSTEHPSDKYIHFHNANSYAHRWPMKIWFGSLIAAEEGGHTPIADCRKVYELIDPAVRDEFVQRKIVYLRNFRNKVGLPWQTTFQTEDPAKVRRYCEDSNISIDLFENDRLRTRQVRQAAAKHPLTGEVVWFNQAHLFHLFGLDEQTRRVVEQSYAEEDLPRNAYYGDGAPIPEEALQHVVDCYKQAEVRFDWESGDFLVLDNMLAAHSRTSYKGERLTVVSFADAILGSATAI